MVFWVFFPDSLGYFKWAFKVLSQTDLIIKPCLPLCSRLSLYITSLTWVTLLTSLWDQASELSWGWHVPRIGNKHKQPNYEPKIYCKTFNKETPTFLLKINRIQFFQDFFWVNIRSERSLNSFQVRILFWQPINLAMLSMSFWLPFWWLLNHCENDISELCVKVFRAPILKERL